MKTSIKQINKAQSSKNFLLKKNCVPQASRKKFLFHSFAPTNLHKNNIFFHSHSQAPHYGKKVGLSFAGGFLERKTPSERSQSSGFEGFSFERKQLTFQKNPKFFSQNQNNHSQKTKSFLSCNYNSLTASQKSAIVTNFSPSSSPQSTVLLSSRLTSSPHIQYAPFFNSKSGKTNPTPLSGEDLKQRDPRIKLIGSDPTPEGIDPEDMIPLYETLDFTDAKTAIYMKTTRTLRFNISMLYLCTLGQHLARFGPKLLRILEKLPPLDRWAYRVLRKTFFRQFCGGETEEETLKVVSTLSKYHLGSVLDYCIEDQHGNDQAFQKNADYIHHTIKLADQHPWIRYSCLKVSSIAPADLLQKVTHLLLFQRAHPDHNLEWNELGEGRYGSRIERYSSPPPSLSEEDLGRWNRVINRLDKICQAARDSKNPLLIDAEWTHYQAAIDYLALLMQRRYNTHHAVVMNTYQMYLKESYDRLKFDLEKARSNKIILGVKLVRGAYVTSEKERAAQIGYPSPIHSEIDLTHHAYHKAMELILKNIDACDVLIATHKSASVKTAARLMYKYNIPPDHERVQFAQLFGMAEIISNTLAQKGYKCSKYLPYGPVEEVVPYLARRLEENHDFLGGTRIERTLFKKELLRRWREERKQKEQ